MNSFGVLAVKSRMAMKSATKLGKEHVGCHVEAFCNENLIITVCKLIIQLNSSHMYAGYFVRMSSEVKCPNVTSKSIKKGQM